MAQQAMPSVSYASSSQCQEELIMPWTILADIVRALAAGVTAIIATFKFIQELRQRYPKKPDVLPPETNDLEEAADDKADNNPR
jgi:hypothetical protein